MQPQHVQQGLFWKTNDPMRVSRGVCSFTSVKTEQRNNYTLTVAHVLFVSKRW